MYRAYPLISNTETSSETMKNEAFAREAYTGHWFHTMFLSLMSHTAHNIRCFDDV